MTINNFHNQYEFLSNFYLCEIEFDGIIFPSVENAYQASKYSDFHNRIKFQNISPQQAKKLGRLSNLNIEEWDKIKEEIMLKLVRQKFQKNPLKQKLLDTSPNELIEGNWWGDTFWGVCNGIGKNKLGKILMCIRKELENEKL